MKFDLNDIKGKEESVYKTLYIKKSVADKIEKIAAQKKTSWNSVAATMLEKCVEDD